MSDESSRAVDDVRRALAMTWKGEMLPITSEDLVRIWCYDTQWFEAAVAELAISSLVENGWLEMTGQGLIPCLDTAEVTAPLGWWPRLESLTNPPLFITSAAPALASTASEMTAPRPTERRVGGEMAAPEKAGMSGTGDVSSGEEVIQPPVAAAELAPSTSPPQNDADPRMQLVPRLVKYIARKSGIEVNEIERRMQRKQRALGPITPWLCLIFIAKEQGLAVDDIIEMFA
ncbi:MAG TPA: DUF2240 family protein [Candidatus Poseidoniales archaeon]|nr:DUF2240 family protein [Candidatus Poseidoniales archaeon]